MSPPPPDIDLETLRLLVAVAETGSLGRAARERGISQPAASARVRAFEARWRLSVLTRSPRGSELTEDGRAVVAWARDVVGAAETMRTALAALGEERRTHVAIAASLTVAEFLLPGWLGELRAREPDLHPRLHVVNSDRVVEMVRADDVEIGFIETVDVPTDLSSHTVGTDRLIVVVEPSHPWARRRKSLPRDELATAEWVLREPGSGTRQTFEHALGLTPPTVLEASSTTTLIGAVAAGLGPGVVSARAVVQDLRRGALVEAPTGLDLERPLTALWRTARRPPDGAAAVLQVLGGA